MGQNQINYENYKNIYTSEKIYDEQNNLKILMKEVFDYDILSNFIKKINITVQYIDKKINITVYNNDKILLIKGEIHHILNFEHNILLNVNRMILQTENRILKDDNILDDYLSNEDINVQLNLSVNMMCCLID